jgi:hypothetical protein
MFGNFPQTDIQFTLVDSVEEVLAQAFEGGIPTLTRSKL